VRKPPGICRVYTAPLWHVKGSFTATIKNFYMKITQQNPQKITPFLWFNNNLEEAMQFYTSVFKNSKVENISRYSAAGPGPEGTVMSGTFQLEGQRFLALNGGPHYSFTPAISFFVNCETQEEVDELWEKLSEGGTKGRCGWLQDKFGLSWQVIPTALGKLLQDPDRVKAGNVMKAMMQMDKIDIETLQQAYEAPQTSPNKVETV
jgi:predicted 3-demethylubiquinone-9 3-methyltransferase (glyoxalase superfamily)